MPSPAKPALPTRPAARLYLITPADPADLEHQLADSLAAADIAVVLLRSPDGDERGQINRAKALAPAVQDRGAALLLEGHPDLVARAGADGAHLVGVEALKAALPTLKPERIAGCGALTSRHDAMVAGEAGADYVMFGEPDPAGKRPAFDAVAERIAWWAELFEVPCIGYAAVLEEVEPLTSAGADFVALGECVFTDPRGCSVAVAEAARRLRAAEEAA